MSDDSTSWFSNDSATFGDRLAWAREATGMNQAQLARRVGVKTSTLAAWEEDQSEPRANRLSMLAGLLNVSIVWLLTGEGEGVNLPDDQTDQAPELRGVLSELRAVRGAMRDTAERAARLEKKLRRLVDQL